MKVINNITDLIGNTPMLMLKNLGFPPEVEVYAKLEFLNPGGSVKDRIGLWIIEEGIKAGLIKEGTTIVEATAGNTGIAVALAAQRYNLDVVFVVPDKFSVEKQTIMRALGAKIINTSSSKGLKGAFEKIEQLKEELKDVFVFDQFNNPLNPRAHFNTTAREIEKQVKGNIDYFLAGAGSGGTFGGIMSHLKEKSPTIKGVLADPEGSIIGGGDCGDYKIEGIGNDFIPKTMDVQLIDSVIKVSDDNAFKCVKELSLKEGIIVGSSSGAAVSAVKKLIERENITQGKIVTVLPDKGDRYLSQGLLD
ncbi:cysteine synthase family protein [Proteinivorax tanatarense]|uniref:Cysteine synthase family protein n=1 Tax=Proteinivorax tanatarense TaxID=1260629 RepID=A0AAU7VQH6_9FIRM